MDPCPRGLPRMPEGIDYSKYGVPLSGGASAELSQLFTRRHYEGERPDVSGTGLRRTKSEHLAGLPLEGLGADLALLPSRRHFPLAPSRSSAILTGEARPQERGTQQSRAEILACMPLAGRGADISLLGGRRLFGGGRWKTRSASPVRASSPTPSEVEASAENETLRGLCLQIDQRLVGRDALVPQSARLSSRRPSVPRSPRASALASAAAAAAGASAPPSPAMPGAVRAAAAVARGLFEKASHQPGLASQLPWPGGASQGGTPTATPTSMSPASCAVGTPFGSGSTPGASSAAGDAAGTPTGPIALEMRRRQRLFGKHDDTFSDISSTRASDQELSKAALTSMLSQSLEAAKMLQHASAAKCEPEVKSAIEVSFKDNLDLAWAAVWLGWSAFLRLSRTNQRLERWIWNQGLSSCCRIVPRR
mmetsp:Transcript_92479/g.260762  ORF Transcript_92479/g.260762 Transcript_92479/m.260762 type:complete len:422 (+) Transcript_92479:61-1326(+)